MQTPIKTLVSILLILFLAGYNIYQSEKIENMSTEIAGLQQTNAAVQQQLADKDAEYQVLKDLQESTDAGLTESADLLVNYYDCVNLAYSIDNIDLFLECGREIYEVMDYIMSNAESSNDSNSIVDSGKEISI